MKSIYLIGFMGAGKSSIGRKLGQVLNFEIIDTDKYIEEKVGEKIASIFSTKGEDVFRSYEYKYLRDIPTENKIVSTGGGIILNKENRDWMRKYGYVIYLHCDLNIIFQRLENDTTRPLFDGKHKERTQSLFEERLPLYNEAHLKIDTTSKSIEQVVEEIIYWLKSAKIGNNV